MNHTCSAMRRLISNASDRTLTTDERAELRAHLAICPDCRAFELNLRGGLAGIARLPRVSGSPRVREAVLAGVHPGGRSSWPRGWRGWASQTARLAGAVTAFALVALVLMSVFGSSGNGKPDNRFSSVGQVRDPLSMPTATPEPAPTVPTTADVYAPQPCVAGQVEFDVSTDATIGDPSTNSPGFVYVTVRALKSTGGAECRLDVPVSLQITDVNGAPLAIEGNPATAQLDATLGAGEASVSFAWLNWCGEQAPSSLSVDVPISASSGAGLGQPIEVTPPCDDPTQPSKLGLATAVEPAPSDGECETGAVVLTASDLDREGDEVYIWAVAGNLASDNLDNCEAGQLVTVTLTDEEGTPLEIDGNGIELMLKPNESSQFQWAGATWTNWCGAPDGANLTVSWADTGKPAWIHVTPACHDASQPSQLAPIEMPPPDDMWPDIDPGLVMPGVITEPPVCDPAILNLSLTSIPTHGDAIIETSAGDYDTAPVCVLQGNVTFTISGADGQPLAIDGNGLALGDGEHDILRFVPALGIAHAAWENWCGEPGPFTITATVDGQEITTEAASGPECVDAGQPSTLKRLDDMQQAP